jgi:quinoprotein glucose dehydrogenase
MTKEELSNISPDAHAYCLEQFEKLTAPGPYAPFSVKETRLVFPSSMGGADWAGVSYDPKLGYIFANASNIGQTGQMVASPPGAPMPFRNQGAYTRFMDKDGYPCNQPPWGELSAVDTHTGDVVWRIPLGSFDELEAKGLKNTGAINLGGSIATAGGVLFIAATADGKFRAFESRTGKELWVTKLDSVGNATPITYRGSNGKQYVAIVAGGPGHLRGSPILPSDVVVAFALP